MAFGFLIEHRRISRSWFLGSHFPPSFVSIRVHSWLKFVLSEAPFELIHDRFSNLSAFANSHGAWSQ